jgi:peptidoglycan/xylan/chitin deacetylase (PgdA/CDA1 family)
MTLGNHSFSHKDFVTTPLSRFQDDVVKGEVVLRQLLEARGQAPAYFRHPYMHTGPTKESREAFERFLRERGYRIAPFTIEAADYAFNALRGEAESAGNQELARRLLVEYVAYNDQVFTWFERLSRELFGRDIPQVLLIHDNSLNAEALPEILRRLRSRGYRFVTLDEAVADRAYGTPDAYVGDDGLSWLYRWSVALGRPMRSRQHPDPPAWIVEDYRRRFPNSFATGPAQTER